MTTTNIVGYIKVGGIKKYLNLAGTTDGATETEIKLWPDGTSAGDSLGTNHDGMILEELALQTSDGSILSTVGIYDDNNGKLWSFQGRERPSTGGVMGHLNMLARNMNVKIFRGSVLKAATAD